MDLNFQMACHDSAVPHSGKQLHPSKKSQSSSIQPLDVEWKCIFLTYKQPLLAQLHQTPMQPFTKVCSINIAVILTKTYVFTDYYHHYNLMPY